jgi:hypothetical protein
MTNHPTRRPRLAIATPFAATTLLLFASLAQAQSSAPASPPANQPAPSVRAANALPSPTLPAGLSRPGAAPSGNASRSGPNSDEVFSAWDKDHNRVLSPDEFRAGWDQVRQAAVVSRLAGMFKVADANHDGKLSSAEYANLPLIKRGGPGAPPLSAFDTSKDGALDEKEYLRMIEALVRAAESQGG